MIQLKSSVIPATTSSGMMMMQQQPSSSSSTSAAPMSSSIFQEPSSQQQQQPQAPIIVEERYMRGTQTVTRKYEMGKFLGKGGFAKCFEFTSIPSGDILAAKVIDKATLTKPKTKQKLTTEIKIHASLNHKHIVKFDRSFEDKKNVYILLELCRNQSLMELMKKYKRLNEEESKYILVQVLLGVKFMHQNQVIHRDLKLGNLFLNDNMEIKIGDFGLATQLEFDGERKRTICGTPNYIAPEILESRNGHSFEVDTWSVGVILFTLLVGKPPFETANVKTTYSKIKANNYTFPDHIPISDAAKSLVQRLLNPIPERRPTIDEALSDPFLITASVVAPISLLQKAFFRPSTSAPSSIFSLGSLLPSSSSSSAMGPPAALTMRSMSPSVAVNLQPQSSQQQAVPPPSTAPSALGRQPLKAITIKGINTDMDDQFSPTASLKKRAPENLNPLLQSQTPLAEKNPIIKNISPEKRARTESMPPQTSSTQQQQQQPSSTPSNVMMHTFSMKTISPNNNNNNENVNPSTNTHHHLAPLDSARSSSSAAAFHYNHQQPSKSSLPSTATLTTKRSPTPTNFVRPASTSLLPPPPASSSTSQQSAFTSPAPLTERGGVRRPFQLTPSSSAVDSAPKTSRGIAEEGGNAAAPSANVPAPTSNNHNDSDDEHGNLANMHNTLTSFVEEPVASSSAKKIPNTLTSTLPAAPMNAFAGSIPSSLVSTAPSAAVSSAANADCVMTEASDELLPEPTVWVKQWADFSNRYGLAYKLTWGKNGASELTGAHFNDSTKLVCDFSSSSSSSAGGKVEYLERKRTQAGSIDERKAFGLTSYPEALHKKVTLIKYFKDHLDKQAASTVVPTTTSAGGLSRGINSINLNSDSSSSNSSSSQPFVYVKRWMKTKYAIIFRLSNKTVQVCFFDNTEIILSSEARLVTYTSPEGKRSTFSLSNIASKPNQEIAKRLKYTKDILYQLINHNKNSANNNNNASSPVSPSDRKM